MRLRGPGVFGAVLVVGALWAGTAAADVAKLLGDLVNPGSRFAGFQGTWTVATPGASDIDHIVVSGSDQVRIQVFGRCENRICNWGALPGRVRTDGPTSNTVVSLAADYNLGFALRHITLHRFSNGLRFNMVTEFTDGSDRSDYETSGQLIPAGTKAVAEVPAAGAMTDGAPSAVQPVMSGTALNSEENCTSFDTDHTYVVSEGSNWKVRDFLSTVQNFGPSAVAARKAQVVIGHYRLAEVCRIGRGSRNLVFFRASGEVPRVAMAGEDCTDAHPDRIQAVQRDDDWKIIDGDRELYDYGSDGEAAAKAVTVIKTFNLNRQCYFDRRTAPTSYWLSR